MTLELRPYQLEAIEAVEKAEARGIQRPVIALPCGSGKTVIFSHLIRQREGRTLVLAHRDELIAQAVEKLAMVMPERALDVGVVKAARDEHEMPIVVASVQSLSRDTRLARMIPDFRTIVVDEMHHALRANTYGKVLEAMRTFEGNGPLTLGVSATIERGDHQALSSIFQEVVYTKTILDLIPKYLCDLRAIQVQLQVDFNALHTRAGDFIDTEMEGMLLAAEAPLHVARTYYEHAMGRKAILFTPTVKTAYAMVDAFRAEGDATIEAVDGTTPPDERRAILRRFHTGETMILSNCQVYTEGADIPSCDCVIVARPTKSKVFFTQMVGRCTRLFPGKSDALVIDTIGSMARLDLMTFAGLFDIPEEGAVAKKLSKGKSLLQALEEDAEEQAAAAAKEAVAGKLVAQRVDLFRARPLHWITAGKERFALSVGTGILWLDSADGQRWSVYFKAKGLGKQTLAQHLDMGYAQGFAEDYARQLGANALVDREAGWRKAPASDAQLDLLRRKRVPIKPGMSKGEASDLISMMAIDWR